jgi:pyruvate/2-oxoglutarate dehydrogenase complex dihydrolipoamide acyltransferase (E2) component
VKNGEVVVRRIAPVFVRVDHRITQGGFALREFLATLVRQLEQPQRSGVVGPEASDTSVKVCA